MARAKRGGEIGKNGEFYNGGEFLPNTDLAKGVKKKRVNMIMMRVDNSDTVYQAGQPAGMVVRDYHGDEFTIIDALGFRRVTAFVGDIMRPRPQYAGNAVVMKYVERFNNGERFITRAERDEIWAQR